MIEQNNIIFLKVKNLICLFLLFFIYKYILMDINTRVVVIDNGTGYTKMGYAGNTEPAFDIPTLITDKGDKVAQSGWTMSNRKIT